MTILGITISLTVLWLALALIFLIIEALTAGLTTIWFAAGAFAALLCALINLSFSVQVVIFFVVSICLLVFTRKIFVEKLKTGDEKTNVEALIGEKAMVVNSIAPYSVGQVKIGGQVWSAVSKNPELTIDANKLVKINGIEGVKLIVTPLEDS